MNIRMPKLNGIETTRRLLAGTSDGPRLLMLTTFDLDEYVYEAPRAGASVFLLKDVPADQEPTTHVRGSDRPSSADLKLHAQLTSSDPPIGSSLRLVPGNPMIEMPEVIYFRDSAAHH